MPILNFGNESLESLKIWIPITSGVLSISGPFFSELIPSKEQGFQYLRNSFTTLQYHFLLWNVAIVNFLEDVNNFIIQVLVLE